MIIHENMETGFTENQVVGQEALEGRPLWLTCCIGCLFLAAALVVAGFVVIRLFAGPGVEMVKALPADYPAELKPYKLGQVTTMAYLSGSDRGKMFQVALSPIRLFNNLFPKRPEPESGVVVSTAPLRIVWSVQSAKPESWYDKYSQMAQGMDSLTFTWDALDAPRDEVLNYYDGLFKKAGMKSSATAEAVTKTDFLVGTRQGAAVQVHLQTSTRQDGR